MRDQPAPERVRVHGPLLQFVDGFRVALLEHGYSLWGAQEQLYLLAHVSRWMEFEGLEVAALTPDRLERYFGLSSPSGGETDVAVPRNRLVRAGFVAG